MLNISFEFISGHIVLDQTAEFAKGIGVTEEGVEEKIVPKPEPMDADEDAAQKISDWKDVDFVTATFGEVNFICISVRK